MEEKALEARACFGARLPGRGEQATEVVSVKSGSVLEGVIGVFMDV